jgi:hypothetical protein
MSPVRRQRMREIFKFTIFLEDVIIISAIELETAHILMFLVVGN